MAIHGKNGKLYVKGFDMSEYIKTAGLDMTDEVVDTTAWSKDSKEYIAGLKDATLTAEGVWDDDPTGLDAQLESIKADEAAFSYYPGLDTAGNPGYAFKAIRSAYSLSQSITDAVNFSLGGQTTEGANRVTSIIPLTEFDDNVSSAGFDLTTGSADGAIVFIHVTGVTDKADIVIEHSDDDGVGDAYSAWTALVDTDTVDGYIIDSDTAIKRWVRVRIANMTALEKITLQAGIKKH